jgi:FixJ family two-component response regulator
MISGQGDITMAVNAIKSGALDFINRSAAADRRQTDEAIEAYARRQAENSSASRIATMHFPGRNR